MMLVIFIGLPATNRCACSFVLTCKYFMCCSQGIKIYHNDMSAVISNELLLYADDSEILVAIRYISNIDTLLQKEHEIVSEWANGWSTINYFCI